MNPTHRIESLLKQLVTTLGLIAGALFLMVALDAGLQGTPAAIVALVSLILGVLLIARWFFSWVMSDTEEESPQTETTPDN